MHKTISSLALAFALLLPAGAFGQSAEPAFELVSLMRVEGELTTDVEGGVASAKVDTELDERLRAAVERTVLKMRFKPTLVGGVPQSVRTHYDLVLAARPASGGQGYEVTIDRTRFDPVKGSTVVRADGDEQYYEIKPEGGLTSPRYPRNAQSIGAAGRVLLALRYSAEGKVTDSAVISTMLYNTRINDANGRRALAQFEKAALETAQYWRVKVVPGPKPVPGGYTVIVPVVFTFSPESNLDADGQWVAVKRLPDRPIPWRKKDKVDMPDSGRSSGLLALGEGGIELTQSARGTPVL